jgi:hypothetical protein
MPGGRTVLPKLAVAWASSPAAAPPSWTDGRLWTARGAPARVRHSCQAGIGLAVPGRPIGPWSRRTGAPQASATGRDRILGPCWVRVPPGQQGHERSPTVTSGEEKWQVDRPSAQQLARRQLANQIVVPKARGSRSSADDNCRGPAALAHEAGGRQGLARLARQVSTQQRARSTSAISPAVPPACHTDRHEADSNGQRRSLVQARWPAPTALAFRPRPSCQAFLNRVSQVRILPGAPGKLALSPPPLSMHWSMSSL